MQSVHYIVDVLSQVVAGAHTEIFMFFLALCVHTVCFGRRPFGAKPSKSKIQSPQDSPQQRQPQRATPPQQCAAQALKAAVRESDIYAALAHLRNVFSTSACGQQQLWQGVARLFIEKDALPDLLRALLECKHVASPALEGVIAECARRGDSSPLLAADDIIMRLVPLAAESAQVALMKSISGGQRLEYATNVFQACQVLTPCLFNALLDVCIDCGDCKAAETVLLQAKDAKLADVVTYNTIIKAYVRKNDAKRARAVVDQILAAGLMPNTVTLNELLDAMINRDTRGAWNLLNEMKAWGVKPNQVTCSILLKSIQAKSNGADTDKILGVVYALDEGMDEVLLSSVIEACIRINRTDLLQHVLKRQRTAKRVPLHSAHAYGSIIRAFGYMGEPQSVWETWREMRSRHVALTSITIGCMVEALCSNGDVDAGYELIREAMADPQTKPLVNAVVYCSVLKGFSHQKLFGRLWKVYMEMLAEGMKFSIVTYNTLVDACARNDEMVRIPALLKEMVQQGIEPNVITYSVIIKGYCQSRRLDEAFELLEDMKRVTNGGPDEHTYNTLLNGCACQGFYERGIKLLEEMQSVGVTPSNFTLSVLMKLCGRARRLSDAFDLCQQLSEKYGLRPNVHVYNNLMNVCIVQTDIRRAFGVLERMLRERVRPDVRTYQIALRGCVSCGHFKDAAQLLRAALGLRNVEAKLLAAGPVALLVPKGGLPDDLIVEVLQAIKCHSRDELAELLEDWRLLPGQDAKLRMRLASRVAGGI